jgi:hypothetical protein
MKEVHIAVGIAAIAATALAGAWGAWCWWRVRSSLWFWRLLRSSQAIVVLQAVLGGVLVLIGHKPKGLHVLYGLLPLLVSFLGEQLRIGSAQMVLDARGFGSAADVGRLPEEEQRVVALTILQREMGVMALAALVIVVLLLRAAMTAG